MNDTYHVLVLMLWVDLGITIDLLGAMSNIGCWKRRHLPDVLLMRKRALVRFASPSILSVPMKDVLMVFTALN
jgi:hypothetical protein